MDPDPIYIRSGKVWTGAGISAGMDLALALVAEDHGERLAWAVARQMVMYLKRQGGQSQFSVPLWQAPAERRDIDELRVWIIANLTADLSAAALAERVSLSERHFTRVFRKETGATPAAYRRRFRTAACARRPCLVDFRRWPRVRSDIRRPRPLSAHFSAWSLPGSPRRARLRRSADRACCTVPR
ncbi:AraC family transcriptional regulator [Streptosporangium sp. CA-135522]|uniref:AraC family transcriptional regulator n=1 Tax=Streptosporangium sp. CA-135522 TaxID=3240072 RepID=UPI003D8D1A6A